MGREAGENNRVGLDEVRRHDFGARDESFGLSSVRVHIYKAIGYAHMICLSKACISSRVTLTLVRWTWNEWSKRCNLTYYKELNDAFPTHENPFLREPKSTSSQKKMYARFNIEQYYMREI